MTWLWWVGGSLIVLAIIGFAYYHGKNKQANPKATFGETFSKVNKGGSNSGLEQKLIKYDEIFLFLHKELLKYTKDEPVEDHYTDSIKILFLLEEFSKNWEAFIDEMESIRKNNYKYNDFFISKYEAELINKYGTKFERTKDFFSEFKNALTD